MDEPQQPLRRRRQARLPAPLGLAQVLLALVCGVLAYRRRPR
ncbi:hypothetical protein D560_3925 [Bordetella holmesii ATCC 51541]|nr:hypothetical protein D560_3925 [Bordetella holmesii ATCC 51541]